MCLTAQIVLKTHATFCEYLVFHEIRTSSPLSQMLSHHSGGPSAWHFPTKRAMLKLIIPIKLQPPRASYAKGKNLTEVIQG